MNSSLGDVTPRNARKMVPAVHFISQLFYTACSSLHCPHSGSLCRSSDNEGIPAEKSVLVRLREEYVTKHKVYLNMKNIAFGLE